MSATKKCPACGRLLKFTRRGFARHHIPDAKFWCLNTGNGYALAKADAPYKRGAAS